jgi:hypothetical protein
MKPYSRNVGGIGLRVVTKRVISTGAIISRTETTTFPIKESSSLDNVISLSGNYKTPLRQSYTKNRNTYISGTTATMSNDGVVSTLTEDSGNTGQGTMMYPADDPAQAYNECLSRLNDQVRSTLDLSVDIASAGQVRKAVEQIFDLVHYVRKFPSHALRSMYKDYLNHPKRVGSKWLEFQYGWRPLAQSAYDTLNNLLGGRVNMTHVRARAQVNRSQTRSSAFMGATTTDITDYSTRVELKILLDLKTNALNEISNYTSCNPASLAWELTPFSFVVDWVVDVGGYIRNLESAVINSNRFLGGYTTIVSRVDNRRRTTGGQSIGPNQFTAYNLSGNATFVNKTRTIMTSYPFPRLPRFKMDLGSGRMLNAAALLSQHLGHY